MYTELVNAIYDIITVDDVRDLTMKGMQKIPGSGIRKFISFGVKIDQNDIITVKKLKLNTIQSPIYIIKYDMSSISNNDDLTYYTNVGVIDGEVALVMMISDNMLRSKLRVNRAYAIASALHVINSYIFSSIPSSVIKDSNMVDVLYYSTAICSVFLIDRIYPETPYDDIADVLNLVYNTDKITPTSVESMVRLLDDITLTDLLDNSIFLSVTNEEYPEVKFADIVKDSAKEEDLNEETSNV